MLSCTQSVSHLATRASPSVYTRGSRLALYTVARWLCGHSTRQCLTLLHSVHRRRPLRPCTTLLRLPLAFFFPISSRLSPPPPCVIAATFVMWGCCPEALLGWKGCCLPPPYALLPLSRYCVPSSPLSPTLTTATQPLILFFFLSSSFSSLL